MSLVEFSREKDFPSLLTNTNDLEREPLPGTEGLGTNQRVRAKSHEFVA